MTPFVAIPFVVWPLQCVKLTSATIGVKLNALLGNYDEPTDHQMDQQSNCATLRGGAPKENGSLPANLKI